MMGVGDLFRRAVGAGVGKWFVSVLMVAVVLSGDAEG